MNELANKKLKEWRSGAIRHLYTVEQLAGNLRAHLEGNNEYSLASILGDLTDLHSEAMTLITLADRSAALGEAGVQ